MRKYMKLLFVPIILFASVSAFAYSDDGNVAQKWSNPNPNDAFRIYQLVRYADNAQNQTSLTAGDVVVWNCVSDDGVTVDLVGATNSTDAVAGVIVNTIPTADQVNAAGADINRRNWGWMQIYGLNTVCKLNTGGAAGTPIEADLFPRFARGAPTLAVGAVPQRLLGFAMDASGGSSTNDVFVDVQ